MRHDYVTITRRLEYHRSYVTADVKHRFFGWKIRCYEISRLRLTNSTSSRISHFALVTTMRKSSLWFALILSGSLFAQVAEPSAPQTTPQQMVATPSSNVVSTLSQLQSTIENARVDLARLRVDKWKADSSVKQQTAANVESLQRNMTGALPTLVTAAQQNPSSLNASFKLYRNVNVLYDVMTNVTESAGALGAKEEYAALARDLNGLDNARRTLADAMDAMTAQRDADFARMQQAARQVQQQAATPPKKTLIDDNATEKKPAPKKKKTTAAPKQ